MEKLIIRSARDDEHQILTAIKTVYIRSLYRGYIPDERLKELDPTPYDASIADFLHDPELQVLLCVCEDKPMGYLVVGADPSENGCGMIFDAACDPAAGDGVRDALIMAAAEQIAAQGMQRIYIWILRDNFRVRFLFEQFNFKPEGSLRTHVVEGREAQLIRYVYRIAR